MPKSLINMVMMITATTHLPPPQSLCAAVTHSVFNDGPTVSVLGDVIQHFLGFMRFYDLATDIRLPSVWLVMPTGRRFKVVVRGVFPKLVNTQQSKILLSDKTIDGCVIATVVNKGLTATQSDCGGGMWVIAVIIIAWYKMVV